MATKTQPKLGSPIKPRLSNEYRRELSASQQVLARSVISQLRRMDTKKQPRRAGATVTLPQGQFDVLVSSGALRLNGSWRTLGGKSLTVSDVVCEAVKRGFFSSQPDSDVPEGDHEDRFGEGEGDAPGEGRDAPEHEHFGEGEGDSDGESESESEGEGEAEGEAEAESESQSQPPRPEDEWQKLKRRLAEIQEYLDSEDAEHTDRVSNRPYIDGARMIAKGIPAEGVLHAWAINWPESAREACDIQEWDPAEFGQVKGRHRLYAYIRALIEANVPVFLKGPSQAGKSYVLAEIARDMGMPFRQVPLTGGASTSWLLGSWTPQGFVEAGFPTVYARGGIFLFDEIDAADPNMLIVVNNAVSNDVLDNPRNGERLQRSAMFRPVAAANTWGTGGTADYTGRARMDGATLERFRCGRVEVSYDRDLQVEVGDKTFEAALRGEVA